MEDANMSNESFGDLLAREYGDVVAVVNGILQAYTLLSISPYLLVIIWQVNKRVSAENSSPHSIYKCKAELNSSFFTLCIVAGVADLVPISLKWTMQTLLQWREDFVMRHQEVRRRHSRNAKSNCIPGLVHSLLNPLILLLLCDDLLSTVA